VLLGGVLTDYVSVQEHGLLADAAGVMDQGDDLFLNVPEASNVGGLGHLVPVSYVLSEAGHLIHTVAEIAENLDIETRVITHWSGALHFGTVF